jgi:hypothetical protein
VAVPVSIDRCAIWTLCVLASCQGIVSCNFELYIMRMQDKHSLADTLVGASRRNC